MKGYVKKNCFELIFLLLQAILYVAFLALDLAGGSIRFSVGIKYTIIILCFCYALLSGGAYKSIFFWKSISTQSEVGQGLLSRLRKFRYADTLLLQAGLFFTLISDLFILIMDYYFYGVLVFILVQQLYSLRLSLLQNEMGDKVEWSLLYAKRLVLQMGLAVVVCLTLLFSGVTLESLLIASVFYFICILSNTIAAVRLALIDRKEQGILLFAAGMLLFLLCDINVGLFNLTGFIRIPDEIYSVIYSFSSILMWTFYAPSQVLLTLSGSYIHKQKVESK